MATIEILNQHIDDEEGRYRIRVGDRVGYLIISTDVFDEDTMCRPYLLIPKLPKFPDEPWTRIHITRLCGGASPDALNITVTNDLLPAVETVWHPKLIDVLTIERRTRFRSNVHEVYYEGIPAVSKIAAFEWQMPRLERESLVYSILDEHQRAEPGNRQISPRVLGHLTEGGRVIGLLLERLNGQYASLEDLPECADTVRRLHEIGIVHGDVNRYNFIVDKERRQVSLIDFEHAASFDEATANTELESLMSELVEETGRGGTVTIVNGTQVLQSPTMAEAGEKFPSHPSILEQKDNLSRK